VIVINSLSLLSPVVGGADDAMEKREELFALARLLLKIKKGES
jgi:hypothetical protein